MSSNRFDMYRLQAGEQWPFFDEDEIDAVTDVLRSGKVNQ